MDKKKKLSLRLEIGTPKKFKEYPSVEEKGPKKFEDFPSVKDKDPKKFEELPSVKDKDPKKFEKYPSLKGEMGDSDASELEMIENKKKKYKKIIDMMGSK